jgi:hypothetical protein
MIELCTLLQERLVTGQVMGRYSHFYELFGHLEQAHSPVESLLVGWLFPDRQEHVKWLFLMHLQWLNFT